MSRVRAVLVGLILGLATLLTWEVGAIVQRHQTPQQPPSTATLPVLP